ncbi:homocysteine S-methyltransferase family protein [Nocardioides marmoraquaticus]
MSTPFVTRLTGELPVLLDGGMSNALEDDGADLSDALWTARILLEVLAASGPDVLAVETVPDVDEAAVLVALLDELGLSAWLSYAVSGDRTRAGQPLDEAYAVAAGSTAVVAAGVNCSAPADVAAAVGAAVTATGRPGIAYPNRGEDWDAHEKRWRGTGTGDPADAEAWVAAGARLVGGCCRVGPADVSALRERITA